MYIYIHAYTNTYTTAVSGGQKKLERGYEDTHIKCTYRYINCVKF